MAAAIQFKQLKCFDLSSWGTAFQRLGLKKWIGVVAAFVPSMGFLLVAVLVGHSTRMEEMAGMYFIRGLRCGRERNQK
jgi:hypothetical protein